VFAIAMFMLIPVFVMAITAFKSHTDVVASPPLLNFKPTLEGFVFLLTERSVVTGGRMEEFKKKAETGEMGLFNALPSRADRRSPVPATMWVVCRTPSSLPASLRWRR